MEVKKGPYGSSCSCPEKCELIEKERECAIDSLKTHLSEQRHDFFNLLQVIYGYTQLKKTDRVLEYIKNYSNKLESIGRVYNSKCIKLADLLYTKEKEAGSVDLNFEVCAEISFEPVVRMLEDENVLYVVDSVISAYFYVLNEKGCKNATIVCVLKENADNFSMEISCKEIRNGEMEAFPFMLSDKEIYWSKISRSIAGFGSILKFCGSAGFKTEKVEEDSTFSVKIYKG